MFIAMIMMDDSSPIPVWGNDEQTELATWDSIEDARKDTNAMPISKAKEIIILDLDSGE
jgi:hypothetical protein